MVPWRAVCRTKLGPEQEPCGWQGTPVPTWEDANRQAHSHVIATKDQRGNSVTFHVVETRWVEDSDK